MHIPCLVYISILCLLQKSKHVYESSEVKVIPLGRHLNYAVLRYLVSKAASCAI